ncbi:MAG: hypothetical protein J4G14_07565 [Dehalococcoidia bacterium]|nr:hypothetical protein [Dehalococcoidia bacterium]
MQRVNFASRVLNDPDKPGIRAMIDRIAERSGGQPMSPEQVVDACLDILGPLPVVETTRAGLIDYASKWGDMSFPNPDTDRHIVTLVQLIVTTQEYQTA